MADKKQDVPSIIRKHKSLKKNLIAILLDIQAQHNYLSPESLRAVADALRMPLIDIVGVATFYRAFSLTPRGRHLISACLGTACHVRGAARIIDVAQNLKSFWPSVRLRLPENDGQPHEAHNLRLDCSKALVQLGWRTIWGPPILFEKTVSWYRAFYEERQVLSEQQLSDYLADAQRERLPWVTD